MTSPGLHNGGRVVALHNFRTLEGFRTSRVARRDLALALAALALFGAAACSPRIDAQADSADASVKFQSQVTNPATWNNLWGSWPAQRYSHVTAYDSDRKLIVMYGGQFNTNGPYHNDTWEWNGEKNTWTQRTTSGANPGTRSGHAMAYDPVAKKMIVFSGWQPAAGFFIPGIYEYDGPTATWTNKLISGGEPSARHDHTMVYDPDRKVITLFGGIDETGTRLNDVWDWDGATAKWTQRTITGAKPTGRMKHSMVYDTQRKRIIVYGGNTGTATGTFVNETWELEPTAGTWQQFTTTGTAPTYYNSEGYTRLGHDPITHKTLLYSTYDYAYEWDPVTPTWTKIAFIRTGTDPLPYYFPTLTFDPVAAKLVLIAGYYQARELWEINTADWSVTNRSVPTTNGPFQRQYPSIAFDTKRGKLMVFGGYGSDGLYKQDIWEWSGVDGQLFNRTTVDTKPVGRYQAGMVYDSKRDQLLLWGGAGTGVTNDVWSWAPMTRTWTMLSVTGAQPNVQNGQNMFYDATRDRVVLWLNYYTIWEFNPGTNAWLQRLNTPTGIPTGYTQRGNYEITYDTDRSKMLFIAGYGYVATVGNVYDAAVWEWDAITGAFTERAQAAAAVIPTGRYQHGVTYDPSRRVVVMFAGYGQTTGATGPLNDSWEWDPISGAWNETTPAGVKPLPRYNHVQAFDSMRNDTLVFGGTVSEDPTYGPGEIWEYVPSSAPRPNGSGCSASTAANCLSKNCVDGVCCDVPAAQCAGTCRACNVAGKFGTCSDVPAGLGDDSCASDQACNAAHQCKARIGVQCQTFSDCASGSCADGVCCDTACNETCKVCNLNAKRGTCSFVPMGDEDLTGVPQCTSTPDQGHFCDGNGVCTNAPKAAGKSCTASGQCASRNCIDGVCCNSVCNMTCYSCNQTGSEGTCRALAAGLVDHSATLPCDGTKQFCTGAGACGMDKKPNGQDCTAAADCGSTFCVDGKCCNSACLGTCQSCGIVGKEGSCLNVALGGQDTNATVPCGGTQYCDAAGTCQMGLKPNGATCTLANQCASNFCVDGVCCSNACDGTCNACNLTGFVGDCSPLPSGSTDPMATTMCMAPNYCNKDHVCTMGKKPNGAVCAIDTECGSNYCVDGVCCETSCAGDCFTCKTGTCAPAADGTDPRSKCKGTHTMCAGTCNGSGTCRFAPQGKACATKGCQPEIGLITDDRTCDGAGNCSAMESTPCGGFGCFTENGMAKCKTDCSTDPDCAVRRYCEVVADGGIADGGAKSTCPAAFDIGHACTRNAQCINNTCSDGVCCNINCDKCGTCNKPGSVGTCIPIEAGTDPDKDCASSDSDPMMKCGGMCDGHAKCTGFPAAGVACGTCKTCNGSGLCNLMPEDDMTCGPIDCDTLDTSCLDYNDLTTKRCGAVGTCKAPNVTATCTDVTNKCGADGGAGSTGTGGKGGSGAGGSGAKDGGADARGGGGGGGCGCDLGGRAGGRVGFVSVLFAFVGVVATRRRRRR